MKKLLILTFACCLIGLMPLNLYADLVPDQSQSYVSGTSLPDPECLWTNCFGKSQSFGISQSFIPSMDNVAGASVSIGLLDSSSVTVTMKLWDKEPWDPTSNSGDMLRMDTTTVTNSQVDPNNGSMVSIYWDPVGVTPGQRYFIQVFTDNPVKQINYVPGNPYLGGSLYLDSIPVSPQGGYEVNWDWVFTVYADTTYADPPPAVPEPCSMLLLGCGLVGVVGFRRKLKK